MERDHDLLVELARDMKHLCKVVNEHHNEVREDIKELRKEVDEQQTACACRMKDCQNFFVSSRVFNTILTIAIILIGSVSLVTYQTRQDLAVHQAQLSHAHEDGLEKPQTNFTIPDTIKDVDQH